MNQTASPVEETSRHYIDVWEWTYGRATSFTLAIPVLQHSIPCVSQHSLMSEILMRRAPTVGVKRQVYICMWCMILK